MRHKEVPNVLSNYTATNVGRLHGQGFQGVEIGGQAECLLSVILTAKKGKERRISAKLLLSKQV